MANRQRDAGRERFWRQMLQRQAGSGLSVQAFCRREGLTEPSFYAWRRTSARRDAQGGGAPRVVSRRRSRRGVAAFVPIVVTEPHHRDTGVLLELAGGRRLLLGVELVARLVWALEADRAAEEAARGFPVRCATSRAGWRPRRSTCGSRSTVSPRWCVRFWATIRSPAACLCSAPAAAIC